jgi:hypothetical protein
LQNLLLPEGQVTEQGVADLQMMLPRADIQV